MIVVALGESCKRFEELSSSKGCLIVKRRLVSKRLNIILVHISLSLLDSDTAMKVVENKMGSRHNTL